jgi:regulator of replication initiation timing
MKATVKNIENALITDKQAEFIEKIKADVSSLIEKNKKGYLSKTKLKATLNTLGKMSKLKYELEVLGKTIDALESKLVNAPTVKRFRTLELVSYRKSNTTKWVYFDTEKEARDFAAEQKKIHPRSKKLSGLVFDSPSKN